MATNLIRIQLDGAERWGVVTASGITLLAGAYATTAALIEQGEADWRAASVRPAAVSLEFGGRPVSGERALPHLLSGRQLPPAHD